MHSLSRTASIVWICAASGCGLPGNVPPSAQDAGNQQPDGTMNTAAPNQPDNSGGNEATDTTIPDGVREPPSAYHTRMISVGFDGQPANSNCSDPLISADGRYVVFLSDANNLVFPDTNGRDIFRYDRFTDEIFRVSEQDGYEFGAEAFRMSADGRFIAYTTYRNNYFPGITYYSLGPHFHIYDCIANTTTLVTVRLSDGTLVAPSRTGSFDLSPDGSVLVLEGKVGPFDRRSEVIYKYSIPKGTIRELPWFHPAHWPFEVGPDGLLITHTAEVLVYRSEQAATVPIRDDDTLRGERRTLSLSADGSTFALAVDTEDVLRGVQGAGVVTYALRDGLFAQASPYPTNVARWTGIRHTHLSHDGRFVVFTSRPEYLDPLEPTTTHAYHFDTHTGNLERVDLEYDLEDVMRRGLSTARSPSVSADGRFVAFESGSQNLVENYEGKRGMIFVRDMSYVHNGDPLQ